MKTNVPFFKNSGRNYILVLLVVMAFSACTSYALITKNQLNKIELGMTEKEVVKILGTGYTIAEKRIENDDRIEVLSYQNLFNDVEFYMFVFKNGKLEKWYRELVPQYKKGK